MTNLYIGGSSVFATPGFAKPTYTIVQLALRLGDHLGGGALATWKLRSGRSGRGCRGRAG